ncbi:MAG: FtsX-like permease family protein [Pseudohongiella sp.]|uniref:ABC transporter permease n=1 Tax=Pseudohongiella sp. TaxID=1979412 RepID=UPI0034A0A58D
MLTHLKLMLRSLKRERFYAAINVAGLSVAIVACLLISLHVYQSLTYDQHTERHKKIYRATIDLINQGGTNTFALMSDAIAPTLALQNPDIEAFVRFKGLPDNSLLTVNDEVFYQEALYGTDTNIFEVFGHRAIYGDTQTALTDPNSMAVSEHFNQMHFSGDNSVGEIVSVNGNDYRISLVFEDVPGNSHLKYDVLVPIHGPGFARSPTDPVMALFTVNSYTYFVLPENYDLARFSSFFDAFWQETTGDVLRGSGINSAMAITPIADVHFGHAVEFDQPVGNLLMVYAYAVIGVLILLVAIVNYINLATARATRRFKEVGVRRLLGARRSALIAQFLLESVFLAVLAALIALLVIAVMVQTGAPALLLSELNLAIYRSPLMLSAVLFAALVLGVLAGLYPAAWIAMQSVSPHASAAQSSVREPLLRRALIVFQFAVTISVIAITVLVLSQMHFIANMPLGFEKENRLVLTVKGAQAIARVPAFANSLSQLAEVQTTTFSTADPAVGFSSGNWRVETEQGQMDSMFLSFQNAGADYLQAMGMELVAGRSMSAADSGRTVVVNETLVRTLGWSSPVGMRTGMPGDIEGSETVVGVVRDFHFDGLQVPVSPLVIRLSRPENYSALDPEVAFNQDARVTVVLRGSADQQTLQALESVWRQHMSELPFYYRYLDDIVESRYISENNIISALAYSSGVSIFISCLGLLGLTAYTTERRTREIGIRKVLGASASQLLSTLFRNVFFLVLIASVIASLLSYYWINSWLANFAYRDEVNLLVFPAAALLTIALAFITMTVQAWGTIQRNPVHALRYE